MKLVFEKNSKLKVASIIVLGTELKTIRELRLEQVKNEEYPTIQ